MTANEKDLLQSKTFWGLVISGIAALCAQFGITIDQAALVNDAIVVAGLALSAYGRIAADKTVTSAFGLTRKKPPARTPSRRPASDSDKRD